MGCNCRKSDPLDENAIVLTCEDAGGRWQKLIYLTRKSGLWSARIRERGSPLRSPPAVVDRDVSLIDLRERVVRRACGAGTLQGMRKRNRRGKRR
jgi:hypothetical protein